MIKFGVGIGTSATAVRTEIKRSWYDWRTTEKEVHVIRRERQVGQPFVEQRQVISTSYFVTDVRWRCDGATEIRELFVAGVYANGDAVIEKWEFSYPDSAVDSEPINSNGQVTSVYVPLSDRPLPTFSTTEIYRGTTIGRIRTIEPDPEGRFVLALTRETVTLYRIIILGGMASPPAVKLSQATEPNLANAGTITILQHNSEGRQYHLGGGSRWSDDPSLNWVIILRDGDNDGSFDPPEYVTAQQYKQYGYDQAGAWAKLCFSRLH